MYCEPIEANIKQGNDQMFKLFNRNGILVTPKAVTKEDARRIRKMYKMMYNEILSYEKVRA
tara:strand:+ start:497 stop:679 length:183 start_codon:yes stop_codon:yes gene_type:complete